MISIAIKPVVVKIIAPATKQMEGCQELGKSPPTLHAMETDNAVNQFAYGLHNHVHPHTYNKGKTPAQAQVA